jgi:hypothetical protein
VDWTSWKERWDLAYASGPIRVLVRNGRRLREPQLVPYVEGGGRSVSRFGRELDALTPYATIDRPLMEDLDGTD